MTVRGHSQDIFLSLGEVPDDFMCTQKAPNDPVIPGLHQVTLSGAVNSGHVR